jgi:hypothetical protein
MDQHVDSEKPIQVLNHSNLTARQELDKVADIFEDNGP